MPFKVEILPFLDDTTPACKMIGACNTIFMRPGSGKISKQRRYIGDNTDCAGIREVVLQSLGAETITSPPSRKPALIIGGGGTTRSAIYALHTWLNAGPIYLLNRDQNETTAIIEQYATHGIEVFALAPETGKQPSKCSLIFRSC
jgi:quinate dehydrogenase